MKPIHALALFLALNTSITPLFSAETHLETHGLSASKCECPPDCVCHKPGGTCPGATCSPDCDCDSEMDGRGIWVHPEMRAAIEGDGLRKGASEGSDFVVIDGVKRLTGYHPTWSQYDGAEFRKVGGFYQFAAEDIPEELDYRKLGQSPVRGQQCGDCWAQGGVSAWEFIVTAADKASRIFSVQDVIDNSGFGSCGGGQASLAHFERGAALESEYPYLHGRNGPKKSNVARYEKAVRTFYPRGEDGKFLTMPELKLTLKKYGACEVCGSASSLGSGGRQDSIRSGGTNHCYALAGWLPGKKYGWLDADYLIIKNSWGDGSGSALSNDRSWGDKGYGYYPLAKGDGVHLKGSVITEIQCAEYKEILPPMPIVFSIAGKGINLSITIAPEDQADFNQAKLTKSIQDALVIAEAA